VNSGRLSFAVTSRLSVSKQSNFFGDGDDVGNDWNIEAQVAD
jgi:hypothetical protein